MEKDFAQASEKISRYVLDTFKPEDAVLTEVRTRSLARGLPEIQVGRMDALHLEVLARGVGARKAVEIGTLGGYSGIALARGLGPEGRLYTFDIEPKHAEVAAESFRKAGVASRVEQIVGPATEKLSTINDKGPFDLVFVDADKPNYVNYLGWAAENLRLGGVLLADNTLGFGMIADAVIEDEDYRPLVEGLRVFNKEIVSCGRFRATMLPTGEGLVMAVKIK